MDKDASSRHSQFILSLVIIGVAVNGIFLITSVLLVQFLGHFRGHLHNNDASIGLPLLAGLTLIYLSSLLARRKRTAWLVIVPVYAFVLGINITQLMIFHANHDLVIGALLRDVCFPLAILAGLGYYRNEFTVKSDLQSFRQSLPIIIIVVVVTFMYGTVGFLLMDDHDFHHEIGWGEAMHRTIDQFGLTTNQPLTPYSRRARLFVDSLSVISIGALAYVLVSLFQPLRARFIDQSHNRRLVQHLLASFPSNSEDFFKLWPHDKLYFFNEQQSAGLAIHVYRGIALIVGDPAGDSNDFNKLIEEFALLCRGNDWLPAFIHVEKTHRELYEQHGFALQKIGEEAVLDLEHFQRNVVGNKYFRQISNKFLKMGYSAELLTPPYDVQLMNRLHQISNEWLSRPGRAERGFMMGYFTPEYIQQCSLMVARDENGIIQAFINQIPSFDNDEANFDLLRHSSASPGNINDFLLMNFISTVLGGGYKRLNLGLCPLSGLEKDEANHGAIDSALRFAYANGDRLYSFSGLRRFKAKYEPEWSPRYIAYRGGIRGFTRTVNALNRAMKVKNRATNHSALT